MFDKKQYGFFIPNSGKFIKILTSHIEYCRDYIRNVATIDEKDLFENFLAEYIKFVCQNPSLSSNPYIDFCIMVLGWCKVGDVISNNKITICYQNREGFNFQKSIYIVYSEIGYTFEIIPKYEWLDKITKAL